MAANFVTKTFSSTALWTCPSNVRSVDVTGITYGAGNFPLTGYSTFAALSNGSVYAWGQNASGEVADGGPGGVVKSIPARVIGGLTFTQIQGGENCFLAIDSTGDLYGWGDNFFGHLGTGVNNNSYSSPVKVIGGLKFSQVSLYGTMSQAMDTSGNIWCWGNTSSGEAGNGTSVRYSSPVQVVGGIAFSQLGAAYAQANPGTPMALQADGTGWSWGANGSGQLGDGTSTSRSTPVRIVGGLKWKSLFSAIGSTYGITLDGTLYAWGDNTTGQLGNGDTNSRSSPVPVLGGLKFLQVSSSTGSQLALGLSTSGDLYGWGLSGSSAVLPTSQSFSSPVLIVGGLKMVQLGCTSNNIFSLRSTSASLWASGAGSGLGNGSSSGNISASVPVQVTGGITAALPVAASQTQTIAVTPGQTYLVNMASSPIAFGATTFNASYSFLNLEYYS